ncbi:hypothetical protein FRC17_004517, partial [Serendipita sp. 399]
TPSPGTSPTLAPVPLTVVPPLHASPPTEKLDNNDSTLEFPPIEPSSPLSSAAQTPLHEEEKQLPALEGETAPDPANRLSLISLLEQADSLYQTHPPSSIKVSSIMGPQSVLFTWCETQEGSSESSSTRQQDQWSSTTTTNNLISDDMAEKMVLRPELVVKAWKDEDEEEIEREAELARARRKKYDEERMIRRRREGKYGIAMLSSRGRGSVVIMGGAVIVVVVGMAIAVYGKNGFEWRKWIGRSPWIPKSLQLKSS